MRAGRPRTHAGKMPAHPCGQDARAPALYGERPARCCGAGYRTLARRSTPGVGIVRIVRPCERDARAPMRAGRPRTHAGRMPVHPCGQDARAPMRAGRPRTHAGRMPAHPCRQDARAPMRARCPRTHAGGTPAHPCGQDARAPMRAGRPRTRAARSSIMLNCAVCDVLFGWRVAPGASCTDTEGCVFQSTGDSGATASYPALRRRGRRRGR
jgi:hypothetical protein